MEHTYGEYTGLHHDTSRSDTKFAENFSGAYCTKHKICPPIAHNNTSSATRGLAEPAENGDQRVYLLVVGELLPVLPPLGEVEHDRIHDQFHHEADQQAADQRSGDAAHGVGAGAV